MLARALLQTSLVLWLAQQTLQGGVKPQSVSWGRVLPARGVGVGVKPGVAGALGALGNRYGSKAMKTGLGRYPGAHLGVGGYRSLGLGGKAGLKQNGYGTQGAYGASLGPGMGLGAAHTNGLGLGMGQAAKRVYGAGVGTQPGYGAVAGVGYPGARPGLGLGYPTGQRAEEHIPGASAADLGGPELVRLGQAVEDLKREKGRALGPLYEKGGRTLGLETPVGRDSILGPSAPESQGEGEVKGLHKPNQHLGLAASQTQGGHSHEPTVLKPKSSTSHGATLAAGRERQQLPLRNDNDKILSSASSQVQSTRDNDSPFQQNQRAQNCGDLFDLLKINHHELLGSETQRGQGSVPLPHLGEARGETQDVKGNMFPVPKSQGARHVLSGESDMLGVKDLGLVTKDRNGLRIHGTIAIENRRRGSLNLQIQGRGSHRQLVIPQAGGTQSLGIALVEGQGAKSFTGDGQEAKPLYHSEHDVRVPKALNVPRQTGRNNQATRYLGGAGNYLGTNLGNGGYGPGLGQGAYLGGAAGKLGAAAALGQGGYPQGVAGKSTGYGDGTTGYLGAVAGNGYGGDAGAKALAAGYGNGYSDGYGAGLGYPTDLADGAENKAGKRKALGTGGYAGHVQGAYGALGAGLESTGGKYGGGAAQVPYGNAPVIPTGLEGEAGYPYAAQQLGLPAEGAKSASKYGYGAQLGATQDALGEQAGKYGGVNGALGNGYKG